MSADRQLQFDKGIMRLSAYDPLSNQYEVRILTLPELPLLESLEHIFSTNIQNESGKPLRLTKSCNNKKPSRFSHAANNVVIAPRRCQSNPNLAKQQQQQLGMQQKKKLKAINGSIRSKRSLSSAFNAVTGFIQKANKKIRSPHNKQEWSTETWIDELRLSSDSSISALDLVPAPRPLMSSRCENWWTSSPPISSF